MSLAFNLANAAVFALIVAGALQHSRRRLHVRMMLTCFVLDLGLLVGVEIMNQAVERVMQEAGGMPAILIVHIGFSVLMLAWWIVQIVLGRRLLRGREDLRGAHHRNAGIFLLLRAGNLVTAFFV